jgi:hypothetical protein
MNLYTLLKVICAKPDKIFYFKTFNGRSFRVRLIKWARFFVKILACARITSVVLFEEALFVFVFVALVLYVCRAEGWIEVLFGKMRVPTLSTGLTRKY